MARYRNTAKVRQPCRIAVDQQGIITIIAPYNKKFVDEWQQEITRDNFEWIDKDKKFRIKPSSLEKCVTIAQKYFPRVEGLEDIIESPYDTLKVTENAPVEVCRAAHKALSVKYHPDKLNNLDHRNMIVGEHSGDILDILKEWYPAVGPDSFGDAAWERATKQFCTDLCAQYTEALTEIEESLEGEE